MESSSTDDSRLRGARPRTDVRRGLSSISPSNERHDVHIRVDLLLSAVALLVLWLRRRSVLDLWLMIAMCAFVIELFVNSRGSALVGTADASTVSFPAALF